VERCPLDLKLMVIMQGFPGAAYTRDSLLNEEAGFVDRMLILLDEQGKEAKRPKRR